MEENKKYKINLYGSVDISKLIIIFASLFNFESKVKNLSKNREILNLINILRNFDVLIRQDSEDNYTINCNGCWKQNINIVNIDSSYDILHYLLSILMTKKFRTFITGNNEFIKRNFNEFEFLKINNVGIFKKDCNLPLLINGNLSNQKSEFEVNNTIEKNSMLFYAIDNKKNIIIKESNFKDEYLESIMKYYGICIKENKFEDKNFLTREIKKCKNIFVESIDKLDSKEFFVPSDLKEAIYTIFIGIILDKKNFIIKNVSLSENNDTIIKILIECGIDIEFENQKVVNNLKICDLYVKNYNFKEFSVSKCRLESIIDLYPLLVFINILNKNKFKLYNFKEIKNKEKNNSDFLYNIMSNANVIITEYRDFVEFDATLANFEKIQKINIESNANIKIVLPLILFNIVKNNLNDNYFDYNYEINNIFPNFEHVLREFK